MFAWLIADWIFNLGFRDELQVDQEEGDSEGSGRYGTIPPFPPPPPGLDGIPCYYLIANKNS